MREYLAGIDPEDEYLRAAGQYGSGIRILRQDVWEMIITIYPVPAEQYPADQRADPGGQRGVRGKDGDKGGEACTMPSLLPERLAAATEEELRALKLGYRSRYICGTARMAASGEVDLDQVKKMDYPEARAELLKLPGIGGKVADCICLFALHHMDAFPVDTHIQKVLDARYGGKFPFEKYRGCAGVMQQYIFYYDLHRSGQG